jgi:hypothetical protein
MVPWGIESHEQFRPAGPPALDSEQYLADYNEVRLMGSATSPLRTADQTDASLFWESAGPTAFWDRLALDLVASVDTELSGNAHLLATLNLAIADAIIACWDSKYHFEFWRPVTAIRLADDPGWTPLLTTPSHPEYTSGHSSASSAAVTVLADYFGDDTPFLLESPAAPVGFGSVRAFPRRSTRSLMPAYSPAFTSGPPARMARTSAAMLPVTSSTTGWSASTAKVNSRDRLDAKENDQSGEESLIVRLERAVDPLSPSKRPAGPAPRRHPVCAPRRLGVTIRQHTALAKNYRHAALHCLDDRAFCPTIPAWDE